jgi:hypothetical protein
MIEQIKTAGIAAVTTASGWMPMAGFHLRTSK